LLKIVIADHHPALRRSLRAILEDEPDWTVAGEAEDGDAALNVTRALQPDILLADMDLPEPNGIEIARQLAASLPDVCVIVLSLYDDPCAVTDARRAGARGLVLKRAAQTELIDAVRAVSAGGAHWPVSARPEVAARTSEPLVEESGEELLPEEIRLLQLLACGRTTPQMAQELGMPAEEVQERRERLMARLGLQSRIDAMRYSQRRGWL
jgi:DNA-binding NarL/FixJ family response regulator